MRRQRGLHRHVGGHRPAWRDHRPRRCPALPGRPAGRAAVLQERQGRRRARAGARLHRRAAARHPRRPHRARPRLRPHRRPRRRARRLPRDGRPRVDQGAREAVSATAQRRGAVLALILTGYLLILIDVSILMAALPRIHADLGFSPAGLSWAQNAYTLTFGGLLLLGARVGDLLGRRRTFMSGIALFTGASLAVGTAQSPGWMIAARAA